MEGKAISLYLTRLSKLPQWLRLFACRIFFPMRTPSRNFMVTSMDLADHLTLRAILGQAPSFHSRLLPSRAAHYLGWGRKWSGKRAVAIAQAKGGVFQLVEDGFLRSVERDGPVLSMIFDNKGIFYDANSPSALEYLVRSPLSALEAERVQMIIKTTTAHAV